MAQRLFTAIRPPDHVLDHLASAMTTVGLGPAGGGTGPVRWTARENWHLTLAFYGTVPDGVVDELSASLAAVAAATSPMTVRLRGAGVFSRRTLWVGLAGEVEPVVALIGDARRAGDGLTTFEDERVRARPHLTVARVTDRAARWPGGRAGPRPGGRGAPRSRAGDGRDVDPLAGPVHALALYEGPSWRVTDLLLVRSEPGRGRGGGPLYTDVARHALGA